MSRLACTALLVIFVLCTLATPSAGELVSLEAMQRALPVLPPSLAHIRRGLAQAPAPGPQSDFPSSTLTLRNSCAEDVNLTMIYYTFITGQDAPPQGRVPIQESDKCTFVSRESNFLYDQVDNYFCVESVVLESGTTTNAGSYSNYDVVYLVPPFTSAPAQPVDPVDIICYPREFIEALPSEFLDDIEPCSCGDADCYDVYVVAPVSAPRFVDIICPNPAAGSSNEQPGPTLALYNGCDEDVSVWMEYAYSTGAPTVGGDQCTSKFYSAQRKASICQQYYYQIGPQSVQSVGAYAALRGSVTLRLGPADENSTAVVRPNADNVQKTRCVDSSLSACLPESCVKGEDGCFRLFLVDPVQPPSFINLTCAPSVAQAPLPAEPANYTLRLRNSCPEDVLVRLEYRVAADPLEVCTFGSQTEAATCLDPTKYYTSADAYVPCQVVSDVKFPALCQELVTVPAGQTISAGSYSTIDSTLYVLFGNPETPVGAGVTGKCGKSNALEYGADCACGTADCDLYQVQPVQAPDFVDLVCPNATILTFVNNCTLNISVDAGGGLVDEAQRFNYVDLAPGESGGVLVYLEDGLVPARAIPYLTNSTADVLAQLDPADIADERCVQIDADNGTYVPCTCGVDACETVALVDPAQQPFTFSCVEVPPSTGGGAAVAASQASENSSNTAATNASSGGNNTAAIAGGIVGGVAAAGVALLAAFIFVRRRHARKLAVKSGAAQLGTAGSGNEEGFLKAEAGAALDKDSLAGADSLGDSARQQQAGQSDYASTSLTSNSIASAMLDDPVLRLARSQLHSTDSQLSRRSTQPRSPHSGKLSSRGSGLGSGTIDARSWAVPFEELTIVRPIGEGSFGKVYLARWHQAQVAVKLLIDRDAARHITATMSSDPRSVASALATLSKPLLASLEEEAGLLASLRHPNVVYFLGVCDVPPAILTEYCSRGSLSDLLLAARRDGGTLALQLTWRRRVAMALDAALGMLYLHTRSPPIIHRDLKSPNLLVDESWRVKVSDFNLSRLIPEDGGRTSSTAATNPRWLAPEVLRGGGAAQASDVYSFGVVLWELLTWRLPWSGVDASPWQLVHRIISGERLAVPPLDQLPGLDGSPAVGYDAYLDLMSRCWAQEPAQRPTFSDVTSELSELLDRQQTAPSPREQS